MSTSSEPAAVKPELYFITGNARKLEECQQILGDSLVTLRSKKLDLPELQGEPDEVAREKCRLAARDFPHAPFVTEDTSLGFDAWQGLPGPYIKFFIEKVGAPQLPRCLAAFDNKRAVAQCIFALHLPGVDEPRLFVGRTPGTMVESRGANRYGFDEVFEADDGAGKTFAEMEREEKNAVSHRYRALMELKKWIVDNPDALRPVASVAAADAAAPAAPAAAADAAAAAKPAEKRAKTDQDK